MSASKIKPIVVFSALALVCFFGLMIYALRHDPNALPSQLIGKTAPAFSANVSQGGVFNSADQFAKGRWVVINFWSTTCIVCRDEAPELERFYLESTQKGSEAPLFVSINIQESTKEILGYANDFKLSYPIVSDKIGKISLDYGVTGTPETFFIDPAGRVRHRVAGEVTRDTIFRFIEWLEKNPDGTAQDALNGFARLRKGQG